MSNNITYITVAPALEGTALSLFVTVFIVLQLTYFHMSRNKKNMAIAAE